MSERLQATPTNIRPSQRDLRDLTPARVSLPITGNSITTSEVLNFQLAHAQARDAVHAALDLPMFVQRLTAELLLLTEVAIPILQLRSNAPDHATYLRQPNLGRTLHPDSAALLEPTHSDLAVVIADGLSALAIERHAIFVLEHLLPALIADRWTIAPLSVVQQGRVAIGDPIGAGLQARCTLVLIGERPGLTSSDSIGAYLTWSPGPARTDADRNCLSNIRTGGLHPEQAAHRLLEVLQLARDANKTGISLKEGAAKRNLIQAPH